MRDCGKGQGRFCRVRTIYDVNGYFVPSALAKKHCRVLHLQHAFAWFAHGLGNSSKIGNIWKKYGIGVHIRTICLLNIFSAIVHGEIF